MWVPLARDHTLRATGLETATSTQLQPPAETETWRSREAFTVFNEAEFSHSIFMLKVVHGSNRTKLQDTSVPCLKADLPQLYYSEAKAKHEATF